MKNDLTAFLTVRSYELDSFGHVNNAVYLQYLEYARAQYLLQRGLSFQDFQRWDAIPYVVKAEILFKSSARVHDLLCIAGEINKWGRSSFVIHHTVQNKSSGKIAALADLTFAFVNQHEKLIAIPLEFKAAMS
jgi:YbgC/YbaW family acyl-CoA thioester hydrolase